MAKRKKEPDWEAIQASYRAGQLSVRGVAEHHGISESTLRSRAKACNWSRDLTGPVAAATREKVSRMVSRTSDDAQDLRNDEEIISAKADEGAAVAFRHITSLAEWEQTANRVRASLKDMEINADNYLDVTRAMNTGIDAQLKLISAQRKAFNLDALHEESYEDRLMRVLGVEAFD